MDAKTIAASTALAVAASVGATQITNKAPQELTIKVGAKSLDQAVYEVTQLVSTVRELGPSKRWAVVDGAQTFAWWCQSDVGDVPCPAKLADELERVTDKGISARLIPAQVGEEIRYEIRVQEGKAPPRPEYSDDDKALLGIKE